MALAQPVANPGSRGQDMRYSLQGLSQIGGGVYTDGVYHYDSNGLSLDRPNAAVSGLPPADASESYNVQTGQYSLGRLDGGGGGGGGIPGAAVIAQAEAAGLAQYKKALAQFNQQRQNTMTQYGYVGDTNQDTGVVSNMRVDPTNPYGIYQSLRHNNAMQYASLRDQAFDRGLGGKGLGAQGVAEARFGWGSADAAMAQALQQTLSGFDRGQQDAYSQYQNLLWQMELERIREESMNMPQWYPSGGGDGGGGDSGGGSAGVVPGFSLPYGGSDAIKTGGGYYTTAKGNMTAKWNKLAGT